MKKVALIVEDEAQIAELLSDYLKNDGFDTVVLLSGERVVQSVMQAPPDIMLLDIMLPAKNGVEICREIRKFSEVPIIFITAKVEEIDRLIGLEIGADDYICKPFSPREVVARVNTVLRRARPGTSGHILRAGPIAIDEHTRAVTVDETAIELTPNEYELLKTLIGHPGRVFSRAELVAQVQGYNFEGYERAIDSHVKNLRKKIAAIRPENRLIQTVYGVGYRFEG